MNKLYLSVFCIKITEVKEKSMNEKTKIPPTDVITKHVLSEAEMDLFATNLAVSFAKYPLFEYFSHNEYSIEKMKTLWKVSLKTLSKTTLFISESEEAHSLAVFQPWENKKLSIWKYIKAGGIPLILQFGLKTVIDMAAFEDFALNIQTKYATSNCFYLYAFATLPQYRGQKYGSKIMRHITKYLDKHQKDCYLETHTLQNAQMYKNYGFQIKEVAPYPNTPLTLYAMLRTFATSHEGR